MKRGALFVVLGIWGLIPANLLALDQKTIDERVKQMQMMSKVDRDRLDRNIQAFQALSNEQKAQYRNLHEELVSDRAHAGGLSALLQTYSAWVHTLSPAQRDEIQHEPDSAKKLVIVRRIKEENEHLKVSAEPHHEDALARPNPKFPPKYALDPKDLAAAIKVIVDSLPADRMRADFEQLQLNMYLPIINTSSQLAPNYREWPDESMVQRMTAAIRNKESATVISKSSSKREAIVRLILTGIMRQANDAVRYPTEEERIQTHDSLTPPERQKIMGHHRDEAQRLIMQKFFEAKGDDSFAKMLNIRRQVVEMFERLEVPPPPQLARPKSRLQGKG